MKNKIFTMILVLVMCLTVVSCSSKPAATPEPAGGTETETESDFSYVQDKGNLVIGYTVYEPMNYTDGDGVFTGFDTELAMLVCEKLGLAPNFVEIDWNTKEIELAARSIDCIWNGLTINDERKQNMEVTTPYIKNAQVVIMKSDAQYDGTASLADKTVCAEAGSAGEDAILDDDNLKNATFVSKEVQTACLMEVAAGTVDAAVLDLTLAKAMIGEGTNYADLVIKDRLAVEDYGVAFRKGSDICERVNAIFADFVTDGTMKDLADKYGLDLS